MIVVLVITALLTSMISAIIGMGGGILLLAVMLCYLPHAQAIPIHGLVQLMSNSTRILAYANQTDWGTVRRFGVGAVLGSALGAVVLWRVGQLDRGEPYLKMLVGAYVLLAPFVPRRVAGDAPAASLRAGFVQLGFLAGTLALTIGAVGPLIGPIFARRGFVKERLIATKASCQMVTHVLKVPAFLLLGQQVDQELGLLTAGMMAVVIPGTFLGRALIRFVSPRSFMLLYRGALVVAGLKVLCIDGLHALLR